MPIKPERLVLAKRRLQAILHERSYANLRQLEMKISESGPTKQRCDPHVLYQALKELKSTGTVCEVTGPSNAKFYVLATTNQNTQRFRKRKELIDTLYQNYLLLSSGHSANCGDVLEDMVRHSISLASQYQELGSKDAPILKFGNITLPGALDYVGLLTSEQDTYSIAIEDKNIREWLYPHSQEVWGLIHKATVLLDFKYPVLPILITRKLPYYGRKMFKELGVIGFETHHQYFAHGLDSQLAKIKHKDGLGFHDLQTGIQTTPALIRFFSKTVPEQVNAYSAKFRRNAGTFVQYAEILGSKKTGWEQRRQTWKKVKDELKLNFDEEFE